MTFYRGIAVKWFMKGQTATNSIFLAFAFSNLRFLYQFGNLERADLNRLFLNCDLFKILLSHCFKKIHHNMLCYSPKYLFRRDASLYPAF